MKVNKYSLVKLIFILFYVYILICDMLPKSQKNYVDDIIYVICFLWIVYSYTTSRKKDKKNRKWNECEHVLFYLLIIYIVIGIVASIIAQKQNNIYAIFLDIEYQSKYFVIFLGGLLFNKKTKNGLITCITPIGKVMILTIFVCGVLSLFFDLGMSDMSEIRYGLHAFRFLYSHYTYLVIAVICMLVPIIASRDKHELFWTICATISILLTLRSKGISFIAFFVMISLCWKYRKSVSKSVFRAMVIIACGLSVIVVRDMIIYYIKDLNLPRMRMYIAGFRIMRDYFPFGSGFATFANATSYNYYSPILHEYGVQDIVASNISWGFDIFWPNIYGQFGLLGIIVYVLMVVYMFKSFASRKGELSERNYFAQIILMGYMLLASTAESVFFNFSATSIAFLLSIVLCDDTTAIKAGNKNKVSLSTNEMDILSKERDV